MKSPGIEVKPIKQISGGSNFNEVYFTDVRVSDAQRLGAVGQGWQVALTTLMNERASIGGGRGNCKFDAIFELANKVNLNDKPAIENDQVWSSCLVSVLLYGFTGISDRRWHRRGHGQYHC